MSLSWRIDRRLSVFALRVRSLFRAKTMDRELDRELRAHLEFQVEENIARGMPPAQARFEARRLFGGVEHMKEASRDARRVSFFENLSRDLRYTLRGLLHQPMLLLAATVSIALGVGGNIAVFSLAREFLMARPDARRPEELVQMTVSHGSHASYQRWKDLDASGALGAIAGYSVEKSVNWLGRAGDASSDAARSITPMLVTANFFDVTGVPLQRGRAFSTQEAEYERDPRVAVVSDGFWRRQLGGDSAVVGREIMLNGNGYTILGVLAPKLHTIAGYSLAPGVYLPLNRSVAPAAPSSTSGPGLVQLIGRLKPGQSLAQGRAAVNAADRRLGRLQGDTVYAGVQDFARLGGPPTAKAAKALGGFFLLLALVSFMVLLIACANVAGLLIARGTTRQRELAIRLAIGGTRGRVVQQLLIEGFWLALIGTMAGLALSVAFMRAANSITLPVPLPLEIRLAPDLGILFTALGLVLLVMLLSTMLPAVKSTRFALAPALKREQSYLGGRRFNTRAVLLVGQVTVSTVLLVTALLFLRNLARAQFTNPGFEAERALVAQLGFAQDRPDDARIALLQRAVVTAQSLPGVQAATFANAVPLTVHGGSHSGRSARLGSAAQETHIEYSQANVGPRYFETMGIRVLSGREFGDADVAGAPAVVIIDEEFARRYFDGTNPLGSRIRFTERNAPVDVEVVGVVANSKHQTIGEDPRTSLYFPILQRPEGLDIAFVIARTRVDPEPILAPAVSGLGTLDRAVSVDVQPMRTVLAFAMLPSRVGAVVLGTLGSLGLLLAAFGLYAIVSYSVSRRVAEIAIRSALGATRAGIVRLVIRDASMLVGAGLLAGLAIALVATRPLSAFLVAGLSAADPLSFAGTAVLFLVVSALAAWLPSRVATRVSPAMAMRLE